MPSSWRLALNELAARRLRTALITAAVMLSGVLVVAVTSAIASTQANIESAITSIVGGSDARIVHQFNGRFEESVLERARAWPTVEAATARLIAKVTVVREGGDPDPDTGRPRYIAATAIGIEPEFEPRFRHIEVREGRRPARRGEVMLDPLTAEALDAGIGDTVVVEDISTPQQLTVCGIYERRLLGVLQRPQVRLDRRDLAEASGRLDEISYVHIKLENPGETEAFCERHGGELPPALSLEAADLIRTGFDRHVRAGRIGFIVGAVLTFMSASFIILTGFTAAVTERQRELAILRCIGARRRQLLLAQLIAGALIGAAGAVLAVPVGLVLAWLLGQRLDNVLPASFHPDPLGIALALIGSVLAGLVAAAYPAWLASRVSPLRALTARARPASRRGLFACLLVGLGLLGGQALLVMLPDDEHRFWAHVWLGLPALFVGYFLLAVPVLLAITTVLARPLSAVLRLPGGMLHGSVRATPYRHGLTAGALMVGLSVLVGSWSVTRALLEDWIEPIRFADGFAVRSTGMTPEQQATILALPFVESTCPISSMPLKVIDRRVFGVGDLTPPYVLGVGFDPDRFFELNSIEWHVGDPAEAIPRLRSGEGVLVADRFRTARGVTVGDRITLGSDRVSFEFEVVGVVSSAGLDVATGLFGIRNVYTEYAISCVFLDQTVMAERYDNPDAYMLQVDLADTVDDETATRAIETAIPGVLFRSGRWIRHEIDTIASTAYGVQTSVAFAALVVASLGVGNVILTNIRGRRYEYGVMRSIGARRSMLARLLVAESLLLALGASVIGTTLGLHLAWNDAVHYRALVGLEIVPRLPIDATALGWAVLAALTLAATVPGIVMVVRPRPVELLGEA